MPTDVQRHWKTIAQQKEPMDVALAIYQDRIDVRGDHWAEFDEHDSFHHIRSKVGRIQHTLSNGGYREPSPARDELLDSCYDLINYASMLVRHITGELPPRTPLRDGPKGLKDLLP